MQQDVNKTRKEAEEFQNEAAHNKRQKAKAKLQRKKLELKRKGWKDKTKSPNFEKDGRKLWKLVKQLNDEQTFTGYKVTMMEDGNILTGKQTADLFAQQ